jgi:isocitrate/isopropylmalate dehydrogenase
LAASSSRQNETRHWWKVGFAAARGMTSIAGKSIVNPLAPTLSFAMLLRFSHGSRLRTFRPA